MPQSQCIQVLPVGLPTILSPHSPRCGKAVHQILPGPMIFRPFLEDRPTVPTIVFHGDRDTIVHPRNADHVITRSMQAANWQKKVHRGQVPGGHAYTRTIHTDANGQAILEQWCIHGAGHAWSGGSPAGSYTDPRGPDAAREMLRFFRDHPAVDAMPKLQIVRALAMIEAPPFSAVAFLLRQSCGVARPEWLRLGATGGKTLHGA